MFGLRAETQKFTFTSQEDYTAISGVLDFVDRKAAEFGASRKDSVSMCEESLLKLLEYADFSDGKAITVVVYARNNFMGNVRFLLRVPGESFDFLKSLRNNILPDSDELSPDTEEAINNIFLQLFEDRLRYTHRNSHNYIRIYAAKSPYNSLFKTLGAIVLAVIAGLLLRNYASSKFCGLVSENVLEPLRKAMMNALKIVAVPLVFFSLVSCITRFGNLADMRKTGLKCLTFMFSAQTICAFGASLVFFAMKPMFISSAGMLSHMVKYLEEFNRNIFVEFLSAILPASFLTPFLESDVLQLLLLAVLFGVAIRAANAKTMQTLMEEANNVFTKAMIIIIKCVPVIVFCSITEQIISSGLGVITRLAGLAAACIVSYLAAGCAYCAAVKLSGCMSVSRLLRGAAPAMLMSASVLSSRATVPVNMDACEKLGVKPEVYSMSVPMATIFNKNGDIVKCVIAALFLAMMCGIEVTAVGVVLLVTYTVIIVMSASGFTAYIVVIGYLGVPMAAIELTLGIMQIIDIASIALDSLGAVASSVLIAGKENILPAKN